MDGCDGGRAETVVGRDAPDGGDGARGAGRTRAALVGGSCRGTEERDGGRAAADAAIVDEEAFGVVTEVLSVTAAAVAAVSCDAELVTAGAGVDAVLDGTEDEVADLVASGAAVSGDSVGGIAGAAEGTEATTSGIADKSEAGSALDEVAWATDAIDSSTPAVGAAIVSIMEVLPGVTDSGDGKMASFRIVRPC